MVVEAVGSPGSDDEVVVEASPVRDEKVVAGPVSGEVAEEVGVGTMGSADVREKS